MGRGRRRVSASQTPSTDAQPHGRNGCPLCGEHLADPHAPECALGKAVDALDAVDALRAGGLDPTPVLRDALDELVRAVSSGGVA